MLDALEGGTILDSEKVVYIDANAWIKENMDQPTLADLGSMKQPKLMVDTDRLSSRQCAIAVAGRKSQEQNLQGSLPGDILAAAYPQGRST